MRECHICGNHLPIGMNECSRCGNRLTKDREAKVTQKIINNVHQQTSKVEDLIADEKKVKEMTRKQNKVALIAVIISIFIILMMSR